MSTIFNGASNIAQAGGLAALSDKGWAEVQDLVAFYKENASILKWVVWMIDLGCGRPVWWGRTDDGVREWVKISSPGCIHMEMVCLALPRTHWAQLPCLTLACLHPLELPHTITLQENLPGPWLHGVWRQRCALHLDRVSRCGAWGLCSMQCGLALSSLLACRCLSSCSWTRHPGFEPVQASLTWRTPSILSPLPQPPHLLPCQAASPGMCLARSWSAATSSPPPARALARRARASCG